MCLVSGEGPHRVWGRLGVISLVMRSLSCDGGCCHLGIRETAPSLLLLSASTRARVPEESGPFLLPHPPWLSGIMHQLSLHSLGDYAPALPPLPSNRMWSQPPHFTEQGAG